MSRREELQALLERVREASIGSRDLNEAIHDALLPDDPWWLAIRRGRELLAAGKGDEKIDLRGNSLRAETWALSSQVGDYTGSLDAALALVERVLPGWDVALYPEGGAYTAEMTWPDGALTHDAAYFPPIGSGPTRPLAILAALLSALIAQESPADGR